jgi:hypothetical protein
MEKRLLKGALEYREKPEKLVFKGLETAEDATVEIASTLDLLEHLKSSRDELFESKLLNGFKEQLDLTKHIKR